MRNFLRALSVAALYCAATAAVILIVGQFLIGCGAIHKYANEIQYETQPNPTTQPTGTPADIQRQLIVRDIVQAVGGMLPNGPVSLGVVGGIAAIVSGVAGKAAGANGARARFNAVMTEVANDIGTHKDPTGAFSASTTAALVDAGLHDLATPAKA